MPRMHLVMPGELTLVRKLPQTIVPLPVKPAMLEQMLIQVVSFGFSDCCLITNKMLTNIGDIIVTVPMF